MLFSASSVRSASSHQVFVSRYRLSTFYGRMAFSVAGPTVWNSLPEGMWDPECSAGSYRQLLKKLLFSQYWCVCYEKALYKFTFDIDIDIPDDTLNVRMLWLSGLIMRDWMNVRLNYQRQKCGQWTVVSKHMRFVRFFRGFTVEGATNRSGAAKIGNFSPNAASYYHNHIIWICYGSPHPHP